MANTADDIHEFDAPDPHHLLALTSEIVSAHVANNTVAATDLPDLIRNVYGALSGSHEVAEPEPVRPDPAVPIKKSITPDFLICLEDGKKLKMLKRHLSTAYDMTPDEYRERWGLPSDYPMVAPNYAKQRSALAKEIGLGTKTTTKGRGRGRPKKTSK
jgi:Predicted transcriptional regulator